LIILLIFLLIFLSTGNLIFSYSATEKRRMIKRMIRRKNVEQSLE